MPIAEPLPTSRGSSQPTLLPATPMGTVPLWRCGVIFLLTLTMLIADWLNPALNPPQQSGVVMALPDVVKLQLPDRSAVPFYGSKEPVTEGELGTLPSGTQIVRKQYDDIKGHHSILCTVLLSSAGQNSIHRPEVCLPAQGWTVVGQDNLSIPLASGHALVVRKLSLQRENVTQNNGHRMLHAYFMYWFIGRDMTTPSHYMRVFISSWDRIFYNRAHRWAYAMVMAPITDSDPAGGLDAAQTQAMMTRFISQVVPSFQKSEMSGQESP